MLALLRILKGRHSVIVSSLIVFMLLIIGIGVKLFQSEIATGWAQGDAVKYHFPVINYFISQGIDWGYPRGIAMLPGMHVYFATVARILGISSLSPDGLAAFLIQTPFAIAYGAVLALAVARTDTADGIPVHFRWLLVPFLLSSGYAFESWVWPTTDLPSLLVFAGLIVVLQNGVARGAFTIADALVYSVLILMGTAFRQSFAPLAAGLAAMVVLTQPRATWLRPASLLCIALPLIAAGFIVLICLWGWGSLLPPDLQQLGSKSVNYVAGAHVVALTGLIAWPFALSGSRIVAKREDWWRSRQVWIIALSSALVAGVLALIVPMTHDTSAGRYFSLVWSLQDARPLAPFRLYLVFLMLWTGSYIWSTIAFDALERRELNPELVILFIYISSLLFQSNSWQRYIETPMIISLTILFSRMFKPSALESIFILSWGLFYLSLGIYKSIS